MPASEKPSLTLHLAPAGVHARLMKTVWATKDGEVTAEGKDKLGSWELSLCAFAIAALRAKLLALTGESIPPGKLTIRETSEPNTWPCSLLARLERAPSSWTQNVFGTGTGAAQVFQVEGGRDDTQRKGPDGKLPIPATVVLHTRNLHPRNIHVFIEVTEITDPAALSLQIAQLEKSKEGEGAKRWKKLLEQELVIIDPPPPPPDDLLSAFAGYREALVTELETLALDGLGIAPTGSQEAPTLRGVYIALETATPARRDLEKKAARAKADMPEEMHERTLTAWEALVEKDARLAVFIGEPGSGKSTFVQYTALQLAETGDRIPFRILLRDFAATLTGLGCSEDVVAFLEKPLRDDSQADTAGRLRELLTRGLAVVFFDGLDEVPGPLVAAVRAAIEGFALRGFANCRVAATCRIASYEKKDSEFRLKGFPAPHKVRELSAELRQRFIRAWYAEMRARKFLTSPKEENDLASTLQNAIRASGNLREMAGNPFFLTVMAVLHRPGDPLPDTAAKLMDTLVTGILAQSRKTRGGARPIATDLSVLRQCLQAIAFVSREKSASREGVALDEDVVKSRLAPAVGGDVNAVAALLDDLRHRAGLLQSADGKTFAFAYRFGEFLAGCHLTDDDAAWANNEAQLDARAMALWHRQGDFARKVIIWAAGFNAHVQAGRKGTVCELIAALLAEAKGGSGDSLASLDLAADIARDARIAHWQFPATAPGTLEDLRTRLEKVHDGGEAGKVRSRAASAIGRLGDLREGVGLIAGVPRFDWCLDKQPKPFPAGAFVMGGVAGQDERERKIAAPYRISRYPVTVAQYAAFVAAGGYEENAAGKKWWADGWDWKTGNGKPEKRIAGPEDYDAVYQTPNHPRVGVSWFEAQAFCRWLNSLGSEALGLDAERLGFEKGAALTIRLATEAEWERAARGTERRAFPWGPEQDFADRCNCSRAGIGHTSAVGLFPKGNTPEGIADMSGNVWEWCADWYDEKKKEYRVVRGGSFNVGGDDLSPADRLYDSPTYRTHYDGFRVVVAGSASARSVAS